jgi:hypothetical protein
MKVILNMGYDEIVLKEIFFPLLNNKNNYINSIFKFVEQYNYTKTKNNINDKFFKDIYINIIFNDICNRNDYIDIINFDNKLVFYNYIKKIMNEEITISENLENKLIIIENIIKNIYNYNYNLELKKKNYFINLNNFFTNNNNIIYEEIKKMNINNINFEIINNIIKIYNMFYKNIKNINVIEYIIDNIYKNLNDNNYYNYGLELINSDFFFIKKNKDLFQIYEQMYPENKKYIPPHLRGGYYEKYIKYKVKYLNLKKLQKIL